MILTSSQLPQGAVQRKWRFADTICLDLANRKGEEADTTYNRAAHADANSKLHFILHGHPHGSDVFGRICLHNESGKAPRRNAGYTHDNGKENETDECFRDIVPLCRLLDRRDH